MSVPFSRRSRSRSRRSRSVKNVISKRLVTNTLIINCENCGKKKVSHRMCNNCLTYRGKKII